MSLKEIASLIQKVHDAEERGCDMLNDIRRSGYGAFDGCLLPQEYNMILRKAEIYSALYKKLGIEPGCEINDDLVETLGENSITTQFGIDCDRDYFDDDFEKYQEVMYDDSVINFFSSFTSLADVGDFEEIRVDGCVDEFYDVARFFVNRCREKDLLTPETTEVARYIVNSFIPYGDDGEDVLRAVFEENVQKLDEAWEDEIDDYDCMRLNEIYFVSSKKLGQVVSVLEQKKSKGEAYSELELVFLKVINDWFYLMQVECYSCYNERGHALDGTYYLAFVNMANAETDEGDGVPIVLRNLPFKLYGIVLQELGDRILKVEKDAEKKKPLSLAKAERKGSV
jgi:hypothetical protein